MPVGDFTVTVVEQDGELILELPQPLLDQLGWHEGKIIDWSVQSDGTVILEESTMSKKTQLVLVETVSMFAHRYLVETPVDQTEWALDTVACQDAKEFSQKFLDETVVSHRVVTKQEALDLFRNDPENAVFKNWSDETIIKNHFTDLPNKDQ